MNKKKLVNIIILKFKLNEWCKMHFIVLQTGVFLYGGAYGALRDTFGLLDRMIKFLIKKNNNMERK